MRLVLIVTIITCLAFHLVQGGNQQSVLLENVQTLTLYKGQKTQARRVSSIPQLKCVGGSAKNAFEPDVVQCYNRGSNGIDIQWECTAEMPKKFKFGKLSVSCEGYNYPEDPYILAGSCGLEYSLEYTDKDFFDSKQSSNVRHSSESRFWPFLFKVALIVGVFFALKSFISGGNRTGGGVRPMSAGPDHRPPGGGGGGGWFSNFFPGGFGGMGGAPGTGDARRRQPPAAGFRDDFTNFGNDGADCHANRQQNAAGGGGTANFLTGAALGALGGYVFGNRRTNNQYTAGTANTGWFGTGTTNTDAYRRNPSPSTGGSHTSTGFGGTTRR
uniref:Store-operated calcium entry-associated regulatory factor n=1 Tax=Adineta vaga TaxID=104782 RepID=B2ZF86_ADIVA|nr:7TM protein 66 [Adineta vaga]